MVRYNVKNESNIVPLNPADQPGGQRNGISERLSVAYKAKLHRQMSAPLIHLQEKTQRILLKSLQDMFDKIDDALFELAEKATSNGEQNIFFESMREVRLKRIDIEAQYADSFAAGFIVLFDTHNAISDRSATNKNRAMDVSLDSGLSLMADDAVEEMVALDAMVAKGEKRLSQALTALYARLGSLATVEVDRFNNPLGPLHLCDIFCDACALLNIDIKARLVVFKLYDKYVIEQLDKLYSQANEQLIADGILPDLRSAQHRNRGGSNSNEQMAAVSSGPQQRAQHGAMNEQRGSGTGNDLQQNVFHLLQQLNQHNLSPSGTLGQPFTNVAQMLPVSATPAIGHDILVQLLTAIQRDPARLPGYNDMQGNANSVLMPGQLTNGLRQSLSAMADGGDHSIGSGERDVISLVALLFQFVLDDGSLAEPMKAAISRLQIPIIKVAMQNPAFFSEKGHAARRLLNEMTAAALGWVAEDDYQNDSLYQAVCATVERVCNEFVDDQNLFADVLADFISFVDSEKKRASLREKRVVDAEAGRDQSESARNYVNSLIKSRELDHRIPEFVRKLVESSWNNLLFLTYLKKGLESDEWNEAVMALDDLIWTVSPQRSMSDRTEIMGRIPALLKVLRQGLNAINYDGYAAGEFFAHLEHLHMEVMQRTAPLAVQDSTASTQDSGAECDGPQSDNKQSDDAGLAQADVILDESSPYIAKAKMLGVGQWVEFIELDSKGSDVDVDKDNKRTRCRLVAILRNSGKRIFANRTGVKSGEYTVQQLATRLSNESMVLLEDAQLFDKALSSIIDDLRQSRATVQA